MNPFDKLKRKTDEAARIKREAEEREREERHRAAAEHKRQYKKHEKLVTQVLRDMYNKVFRDHLIQPQHRSKIGLVADGNSYGITSGYFDDNASDLYFMSRSSLCYYVRVYLIFGSNHEAGGFDCYVHGESGKTYDFSSSGLEKLLAELYEKAYFSK